MLVVSLTSVGAARRALAMCAVTNHEHDRVFVTGIEPADCAHALVQLQCVRTMKRFGYGAFLHTAATCSWAVSSRTTMSNLLCACRRGAWYATPSIPTPQQMRHIRSSHLPLTAWGNPQWKAVGLGQCRGRRGPVCYLCRVEDPRFYACFV